MVKSHRLLEPRLAALRPVGLRALLLAAPERLRAALPLAPPVLLRAGFFAAGPERLRPVSLAAPPLDLPAALRLPAARASHSRG